MRGCEQSCILVLLRSRVPALRQDRKSQPLKPTAIAKCDAVPQHFYQSILVELTQTTFLTLQVASSAACQYGCFMCCVISFVNTKGGVGKSFLSTSMAVWLHDQGHPVTLIDSDDQKTSSKWISDIEDHAVEIITLEEKTEDLRADELRIRINERKRQSGYIVVDTKGSAGLTTSAAVIKSDVTCIPLQPSAADIWPLESALSVVRLSQEVRSGLPRSLLILNQIDHRDKGAQQVRHLARKYEIPVALVGVKRLRCFRDSPGHRLAPTRSTGKNDASSDLLVRLFEEILSVTNEPRRILNG